MMKADFNIDLDTIKNLRNLSPSYDKKSDTFSILPNKPTPAVSFDWDGEFWVRVTSQGEIVGIEVENFEKVFLAKHPEVARVWNGVRPACVKPAKEVVKSEACESFIRILLSFLSDLFKTHPQQSEFLSRQYV